MTPPSGSTRYFPDVLLPKTGLHRRSCWGIFVHCLGPRSSALQCNVTCFMYSAFVSRHLRTNTCACMLPSEILCSLNISLRLHVGSRSMAVVAGECYAELRRSRRPRVSTRRVSGLGKPIDRLYHLHLRSLARPSFATSYTVYGTFCLTRNIEL